MNQRKKVSVDEVPPFAEAGARIGQTPTPISTQRPLSSTSRGARREPVSDAQAEIFALYERDGALLYRLALRITGEREDARDAVQECFTRVLENLDSLAQVRSPEAWLRTILTRVAIDFRRKRYRAHEEQLEKFLEDVGDLKHAAVSTKVSNREQVQRLREVVEELSALDRTILLLGAHEDVTSAEVGEIVGLSDVAVRHRLSRARRFLRKRLHGKERNS